MLESAEQVAAGQVQLVGSDGVTVEQVTYTDKIGYLRRVLRLHRHGEPATEFRMVTELAKHVDPTALVAEG